MNWILIIYILGIIAALIMEYRIVEDKVKIDELLLGISMAILSWIAFLFFLLIEFGDKEIKIKNDKSKFKIR